MHCRQAQQAQTAAVATGSTHTQSCQPLLSASPLLAGAHLPGTGGVQQRWGQSGHSLLHTDKRQALSSCSCPSPVTPTSPAANKQRHGLSVCAAAVVAAVVASKRDLHRMPIHRCSHLACPVQHHPTCLLHRHSCCRCCWVRCCWPHCCQHELLQLLRLVCQRLLVSVGAAV